MRVVLFLTTILGTSFEIIVDLPNLGKIQGWQDGSVYKFEGVPYAEPPNRFEQAVPVVPWDGIWQAKTGYRCMQYDQYPLPGENSVIGEENCLFLNIYTKSLNSSYDVIVYIHGGSFMFSYATLYQPDYLITKNIVFVTFNYRLGPLGFLSTEDDVVPGNNGLKDQILALKFLKKYIKYFGGNPDSVTIFGNSAGGASVNFHYLTSESRGLFHRGWSQSGTMLVPWALMEQPLLKTKKLAAYLGCSTTNVSVMVTCLKTRPANQIVAAVQEYQPWLYFPFSPFGPVVDSWASQAVLPQHPIKIIENREIYDVPWVVSWVQSEGLYPAREFYNDSLLKELDTNWNEFLPFILDYNDTVEPNLKDTVSQKIRKYYLGDRNLTKLSFSNVIPMLSDRLFVNDIVKTAKKMSTGLRSPVFGVKFAYRGTNSLFNYTSESGENFGTSHFDDCIYILKIDRFDTSRTASDREMVRFMVDFITSYANIGKPEVPLVWPPFNQNFSYLQINSSNQIFVGQIQDGRTKFWESLPILENKLSLE